MFRDLLFVLLAVSAIIFAFSRPKPEKIQLSIAEVVGSNPMETTAEQRKKKERR